MNDTTRLYLDWRSRDNQALAIGLFGEDLEQALSDTRTIYIDACHHDGRPAKVPILVPLDILEWYNSELIEGMFGREHEVYCYTHPPVDGPQGRVRHDSILTSALNSGAAIVTEIYRTDVASPLADFLQTCRASSTITVGTFGDSEPSRVDFFIGEVDVSGHILRDAPSFYEVYTEAASAGEIEVFESEGAQMIQSMNQNDIGRVWEIYTGPFDELGRTDPTRAGFTFASLAELLADPSTPKFVYRVDGRIITLLILVQKLQECPWFSSAYFEDRYPEYWESGNILVLPGIVSDENRRGQRYSLEVIDLAARLARLRGSNLLLTFECTQVSTQYVPRIAREALSAGGKLTVGGLDTPVGVIDYYYLRLS